MQNNQTLNFQLSVANDRLRLMEYGTDGQSWLRGTNSGLFAIYVDGQRYDSTNLSLLDISDESTNSEGRSIACRHTVARFRGTGFQVEQHIRVYTGTRLVEMWPVLRNTGTESIHVTRIDSFSINLPAADYRLFSFNSGWGSEFEPQEMQLSGDVSLEERAGRSSKSQHPWFALYRDGGGIFSASVAWSGNWILRFQAQEEGGYEVSGGLNDWEFSSDLENRQTIQGPPVMLVLGSDLNAVSQDYSAVGREYWYPRSGLASRLPVEWNHWWSYEDVEINEVVFNQNVDKAAKLGIEVCTLDAGWFGPSDTGSAWYEYRGDWDMINTARFPAGIRPLADHTHHRGMSFGIWCEIEGLGIKARIAETRPDFVAMRDGDRLGYVCFGSPAVQDWAYRTLTRLITEHKADWIKLDFNLDPGAGCNRTDHGHQAGDGLYQHYIGYYNTLERVRNTFPEVVLENCSSGGLRIDLGILRQTHMTFLSDPDWPVHDLQIFWGASTMIAPDRLLHWSFCDWRSENPPPQQTFDPHDPNLTQKKLDYYTRISMLGMYGFSQKLPDLPEWVAKRLEELTRIYKNNVRRFVREGRLYRLTGQPRRSGEGDRLCAFQYTLPGGEESLLVAFRLPGDAYKTTVCMAGLQAERTYTVEGFEGELKTQKTGKELMEQGLKFDNLEQEESALYRVY